MSFGSNNTHLNSVYNKISLLKLFLQISISYGLRIFHRPFASIFIFALLLLCLTVCECVLFAYFSFYQY